MKRKASLRAFLPSDELSNLSSKLDLKKVAAIIFDLCGDFLRIMVGNFLVKGSKLWSRSFVVLPIFFLLLNGFPFFLVIWHFI